MLHNKKWIIQENKNIDLDLDLHPLVKQILVNRGFQSKEKAQQFLEPQLNNLHDPFLMKDMEKVIDRIKQAMDSKENIWVYGDYDVDGITSIALLLKVFEIFDYPVSYYIPNRLEEGYGLSVEGLETILDKGGDLIISVDCGITSVEEVAYVNKRHKDIIITDHHNCQEVIPDAYGVLNPKQGDCSYPFDMLAGVGIALKIGQGLLKDDFYKYSDVLLAIAALGTIADIAPLEDENRIIAKIGLKALETVAVLGLQEIINISNLSPPYNAGHIGFNIGPKLNAAGRIGQPELGVELLMAKDGFRAKELAQTLHDLNEKRQAIEKEILEDIDGLIQDQVDLENDRVIVVLGEGWHSGVIGIVASRITEKYYKPAIVLTTDQAIAKGSARSVGDISIFDAMDHCRDLFIGFGGHKQAAGLSIYPDQVDTFRKMINKYALETFKAEDLLPRLYVDGILHPQDIHYQALDDLEKMEPFGLGNPKPVFVYNGLTVDDVRLIGKEKNHVKLILHDDKRTYDALAFNAQSLCAGMRTEDKIDMVLSLNKNEFRGISTIQFMVKDIRRLSPEFYKTSEIGKLFTKTLGRALFYNGKCAAKQNSNPFSTYNYETHNRLDYATDLRGKKLILVNGFKNFLEVYFRLDDLNIDKEDYGIHFNEISLHHKIDVLIHPLLDRVDYEKYNEVIVYDCHYSNHWYDLLASHCIVPIQYLTNPVEDEADQTKMLYTAVPCRMDLVDLYKFLLSEDGHLTINLYDFAKALHMDYTKCELSLRILEDLDLIEISGDDTYHISILPRPETKLALDETETFIRISNIREDFFEYVKRYKTMIKP